MVGVGSPDASHVRVICSSISDVVVLRIYVILGFTANTTTESLEQSEDKCAQEGRRGKPNLINLVSKQAGIMFVYLWKQSLIAAQLIQANWKLVTFI